MNNPENGIQTANPEAGTSASPRIALIECGPRPSSLSALQTLPAELQEDLFQYSNTHSDKNTARWFAKKAGVESTRSSIARFRRWFHRRRLHEDNMAIARDIMETRRKEQPDITEEELALFGRKVFARLAIDAEDGPEWVRQQLVRQREIRLELQQGRLRLDRQKFEFDAASACFKHFAQIKAVMNSSTLSEPEKIDRICNEMWGKPGVDPPPQPLNKEN